MKKKSIAVIIAAVSLAVVVAVFAGCGSRYAVKTVATG